jgi:hypothetical protein
MKEDSSRSEERSKSESSSGHGEGSSLDGTLTGEEDLSVIDRHGHSVVSLTLSVGFVTGEVVSEVINPLLLGRHGLGKDVPSDTLRARGSGERSFVHPEVLVVNILHELSELDFSECNFTSFRLTPGVSLKDLTDLDRFEELIGNLQEGFALDDIISVFTVGGMEEDTENRVVEQVVSFGVISSQVLQESFTCLGSFTSGYHNHVDFEVHGLSVNGMFGRSVEVHLGGIVLDLTFRAGSSILGTIGEGTTVESVTLKISLLFRARVRSLRVDSSMRGCSFIGSLQVCNETTIGVEAR